MKKEQEIKANLTDLINELNLISKKLNLPDNLNILQFLIEMSECYNNSTSTSIKKTKLVKY